MDDPILKTVILDEINCKEIKVAKNNNQYCSVGIKIGGKWYNGLMWGDKIEMAKQWKPKDKIALSFYQEEYEGKMYSKFKLPSRTDVIFNELNIVKAEIKLIKEHIKI